MTKTISLIDSRLTALSTDVIDLRDRLRLKIENDQEFGDLFQEAMFQAARAVSEERLEYIASLLVSSIASGRLGHIREKHLLEILGEINDVQVLLLVYHSLDSTFSKDSPGYKFMEKHRDVLLMHPPSYGDPQEAIDRYATQQSFEDHLLRLGLMERVFHEPGSRLERFRPGTNEREEWYCSITALGRLLVRYISPPSLGAEAQ